jgi:hypothetical protein
LRPKKKIKTFGKERSLTFFPLMLTRENKVQAWKQVWEGWGATLHARDIAVFKLVIH